MRWPDRFPLAFLLALSAVIVGSALGSVAQEQPPAAMPMFRGDAARTGTAPGPGPARQPDVLWCHPTGRDPVSAPVIAAGVAYLGGSDGFIYALDARSGLVNWKVATKAPIYGSPAIQDGIVYAASSDGLLYARQAGDGAGKWTAPIDGLANSSPAVVDGAVFVSSFEGNVQAFDVATGTQLWEASTASTLFASPAVADGRVVIGGLDGNLWALNAADGTNLWKSSTEPDKTSQASTVAAIASTVALAGGKAYVLATDGVLRAWETSNGTLLWRAQTGPSDGLSPSVVNEVVYAAAQDGVFAFATTGEKQREDRGIVTGGSGVTVVATADGTELYITDSSGNLVAYDVATGTVRWETAGLALVPQTSPVVLGGVVYAGGMDGTLYALGTADPAGQKPAGCAVTTAA
jgi:outer membrane protein assembly factor BamB